MGILTQLRRFTMPMGILAQIAPFTMLMGILTQLAFENHTGFLTKPDFRICGVGVMNGTAALQPLGQENLIRNRRYHYHSSCLSALIHNHQ